MHRRRFLLVAGGAVAAGGLAAGGAGRLLSTSGGGEVVRRSTQALGTQVTITARHNDRSAAERAILAAFAELARVEQLMSIYRPDSQLSQLNGQGRITNPHPDLVKVLQFAQQVSAKTGGAFDITVQPLWEAFSKAQRRGDLPTPDTIAAAQSLVDWRQVEVTAEAVCMKRPGMKITLNGIGQGFAADQLRRTLQAGGVQDALVDAGEMQPLGCSPRGDAWRVGIQHPRRPDAYIALADLDGRALATSGDYATHFSPDRRYHHILDPRTGYSPPELSSVSILAPTAMAADALSTACMVLGPYRSLELIQACPGVDAHLVMKDGETFATSGFPLREAGSAA